MTRLCMRRQVASVGQVQLGAQETMAIQHDEFSTDTLLLYAVGRIEADRTVTAAIEAHLRECSQCAAVVEEARSVAGLLRDQESRIVEPAVHVATMAESLFAEIRPDLAAAVRRVETDPLESAVGTATLMPGLRRILANLTFDSFGSAAFAGLRAGAATSRHLAYQSEFGDLDLQVTPLQRPSAPDARWRLMGQLQLHDPLPTPASISFVQADRSAIEDLPGKVDEVRITADVDSHGYFTVELQSGTWAACMVMEQAALVFPELTL